MTTLLQSAPNTTVASHEAGPFIACSAFTYGAYRVEIRSSSGWICDSAYKEDGLHRARKRLSALRSKKSDRKGEYRLIRLSAVVVE